MMFLVCVKIMAFLLVLVAVLLNTTGALHRRKLIDTVDRYRHVQRQVK